MPPISAIKNALKAVKASRPARAAAEGFDYGVAARSGGDGYGGRYGRSVVTNRTPQALKEGLSPLENVARIGGRVAADSATFASQGMYYAINHPVAISTEAIQRGFSPIGATKPQMALTALAAGTAIGVGSRAYGFNPVNIFRPAGYGASAPDPNDPTQTTNPLIEVFDRFRTRRGQILPYDKFLEDTGQTREQFPEEKYKDLANFQKNRDSQGKPQGVIGGIFRYSDNEYYGPGGAANIFGVDVPVTAAAGAAAIGGAAYLKIKGANQKRYADLSAKVTALPGGGVDDAALTATERADYQRLNRTIGETPEAKLEAKASTNLAASDQVLGKHRLPDYPVQQTRTAAGLSQLDPVQLRNEARSRGLKFDTTTEPEQLIQRIMRHNASSGFEVSGADMNAFNDAFGAAPTPKGVPKANTGPSLRPQANAGGQPNPFSAGQDYGARFRTETPQQPAAAPKVANANTAYEQAYAVAKSRNLRSQSELAQFVAQTPGLPDDTYATQAIAKQFSDRMGKEAGANLRTDPGFRSQVMGTFDAFGGRVGLRDRLSGGRGGAVSRASNIGEMGMAQPGEPGLPQSSPTPGSIGQVAPEALTLDPQRFQYKIGYAKGGATGSLKGVATWNPDLAGVVSVWRDPKDGKDYVVNGHNRIQKALDLNAAKPGTVPQQAVRYLNAGTAAEARSTGALINIAEGQGTAYDAAKFFRDSGATPEKLQAYGIPSGRPVVQQGRALANLHEGLFQQAVSGQLPTEQAIAIGESMPDHADQHALTDLLGRTKRKVSGDVIRELASDIKASPKTVTEQATLFGTEQLIQSNAIEKAETAAYVRKQLRDTASTFGTVSKEGKVAKLTQAGNVLDQAGNAQIATQAGRSLAEFDQLKGQTGAYNDILNEAARRRAGGESASSVNQWAYEQSRTATANPRRDATKAVSGGNEPRPGGQTARIADTAANSPFSQAPKVAKGQTAGTIDIGGGQRAPMTGNPFQNASTTAAERSIAGEVTPRVAAPTAQPSVQSMQQQQQDAIARLRSQSAATAPTGAEAQQAAIARLRGVQPPAAAGADDSLEQLFIQADRVGSKYQTSEEIRAYQARLGSAVSDVGDVIDRQFVEPETITAIDYGRAKIAAPKAPVKGPGKGYLPSSISKFFQPKPAPTAPTAPTPIARLQQTQPDGMPIARLQPTPTASNPGEFARLENRFQNNPPRGSTEYIRNFDNLQNFQGTKDLLQQVRDNKGQQRLVTRTPEAIGAPADVFRGQVRSAPLQGQSGVAMRSPAYTPTQLDPRSSVLAEAMANNPNANYQVGQTPGQRGGVFAYEPATANPKAFLPSARGKNLSHIEAQPNFGAVNRPANPGYTAIPQNQNLAPYNPNARAIAVGSSRSVQPFEAPRTAVTTAGQVPASRAIAPYAPQAGIESSTKVIGTRPRATTIAQTVGEASKGLGQRLGRSGGLLGAGLSALPSALEYRQAAEEGQGQKRSLARAGIAALTSQVDPVLPIQMLAGQVLGPGAAVGVGVALSGVSDRIREAIQPKRFTDALFGKTDNEKVRDRAEQQYQEALKRKRQGQPSIVSQSQLANEARQNQAAGQSIRSAGASTLERSNTGNQRLGQQQANRQQAIQQRIEANTNSGKVISGQGGLRGSLSNFFGGGRTNQSAPQATNAMPNNRTQPGNMGDRQILEDYIKQNPDKATALTPALRKLQQQEGGSQQPRMAQIGQPQTREPRVASRSVVAPALVPGTPEFEKLDSKAKEKALIESSRRTSANNRNDTTLQVSADRSGDSTYRTDARSGDVRYQADARSGDNTYRTDARSGDVRYSSDAKSGDVRATNASNERRTGMQHGVGGSADRVADSKLTGVRYTADSRLTGTVYTADRKLAGTRYTADGKLIGVKYTADSKLAGVDLTSDRKLQGTAYTADRKLQGTAYTADRKYQQEGVKQSGASNVASIKAGATMGAAKTTADGKVAVAGIALQGTTYKADATVRVADVNRQAKQNVEETKASSAINTGVIKAGLSMMQSDEKNRVARLKQLGVY